MKSKNGYRQSEEDYSIQSRDDDDMILSTGDISDLNMVKLQARLNDEGGVFSFIDESENKKPISHRDEQISRYK